MEIYNSCHSILFIASNRMKIGSQIKVFLEWSAIPNKRCDVLSSSKIEPIIYKLLEPVYYSRRNYSPNRFSANTILLWLYHFLSERWATWLYGPKCTWAILPIFEYWQFCPWANSWIVCRKKVVKNRTWAQPLAHGQKKCPLAKAVLPMGKGFCPWAFVLFLLITSSLRVQLSWVVS